MQRQCRRGQPFTIFSSLNRSDIQQVQKKGLPTEIDNPFLTPSGKRGIRTPGPSQVNGFQDRRIRPLCHLSISGCKITNISQNRQIFVGQTNSCWRLQITNQQIKKALKIEKHFAKQFRLTKTHAFKSGNRT